MSNNSLLVRQKKLTEAANPKTVLGKPGPFGDADVGKPMITVQSVANDPNADIGFAEITAGGWQVVSRPSTEVLVFLSGRLSVAPKDSEKYELAPGDVVVFPKAWSGRFEAIETCRFMFLHAPNG